MYKQGHLSIPELGVQDEAISAARLNTLYLILSLIVRGRLGDLKIFILVWEK